MDLEEIRQLVLNCESIPPIDGLKNGSDYRASFLDFPLYGYIDPQDKAIPASSGKNGKRRVLLDSNKTILTYALLDLS